jgi:hypothetical protein
VTTYVVPCGISVLDKLGKKMPVGGSPVTAFVRSVEKGAWVSGARLDQHQRVLSTWWDKVAAKADAVGLTRASPRRLSAETHCLAGREPTVPPVANGRVLLLASDTPIGVSAAFCVGHYLADGVAANLSYATAPGLDAKSLRFAASSTLVTILRIDGLEPVLPQFSKAVTGIGNVLRAAWEADGPVEVHLSGGFKATLLHTLAMTEVLHSLTPGRVSAWYAFEDDPDTNRDLPIPPMRIGLRSFPRVYLNNMRAELSRAGEGIPGSNTFEGLGWDDENGVPKLNAFGYGYLAILGHPVTSLSDDNN